MNTFVLCCQTCWCSREVEKIRCRKCLELFRLIDRSLSTSVRRDPENLEEDRGCVLRVLLLAGGIKKYFA